MANSDLIERLRNTADELEDSDSDLLGDATLMREAADEIERLREQVRTAIAKAEGR